MNLNLQPSVRINAFKVMIAIAKKHVGLEEEIKTLSTDYFSETLSPGIKNSFRKLLKRIS